jgi:nucleotide-binding universal stress UspA family protein
MLMSKKFLVAVDGSEHGWKALDLACDLTNVADAELLVLHVVPYEPMPEVLAEYAKAEGFPVEEERGLYHYNRTLGDKITREAEARARKLEVSRVTTQVAEGNPADHIVAFADAEAVDMIFIGSRGLGKFKGLLMGSISQKVMHLAHCTCVAVK